MSVELVICYANELLPLRTCLAALKVFPAGITIDKIVVINVSGVYVSDHDYLAERDDIDELLDYREYDEQSNLIFQDRDIILDKYLYTECASDYVICMDPDNFVLKEGWGKLLYDVCKDNKLAIYKQKDEVDQGFYMGCSIFMLDRNWWVIHNMLFVHKSAPAGQLFFNDAILGEPIGVRYLHLDGSHYIYYDMGTIACGRVVQAGYNPFIESTTFLRDLQNEYFIHIGHLGYIYSNGIQHVLARSSKDKKDFATRFVKFLYGDFSKKTNILHTVINDGCSVARPDEICSRAGYTINNNNIPANLTELLIIYSGELLPLRSCLYSIKKYSSGIDISRVCIVNTNCYQQDELDYIVARDDVSELLDYRDVCSRNRYGLITHGDSLEHYLNNDCTSDFIINIHADNFVLKEGWGKLLYDVCKDNKLACFINGDDLGIYFVSEVFMINTSWYSSHKLPLKPFSSPSRFFVDETGKYLIGKYNVDSSLYDYDDGTLLVGKALSEHLDCVLNTEYSWDLFKQYFYHIGHSCAVYSNVLSPSDMFLKDYGAENFKRIFSPEFLADDPCSLHKIDPLLGIYNDTFEEITIDLVITYANDLLPIRTCLACIHNCISGIKIRDIVILNIGGIYEEDHIYLSSRKDVSRVLDYRPKNWLDNHVGGNDNPYYMHHDAGIDKYMKEDAQADFVIHIHADTFVLKEGWGKLLYDVCVMNKMACFARRYNHNTGVFARTDIFMIDTKWYRDNNISLLVQMTSSEIFPNHKVNGEIIGNEYQSGEKSDSLFYDTACVACGQAMLAGFKPIINPELTKDKSWEYYYHISHTGNLYMGVMHPAYAYVVPGLKQSFKYFLTNDDYSYLRVPDYLCSDGCNIHREDVLLKDSGIESYNDLIFREKLPAKVFQHNVELVIFYSNELLPLRICLASIKKFNPGISIDNVVIVAVNCRDEDLVYLKKRPDVNSVIDYREDRILDHWDYIDKYVREDAKSSYVMFLHPDTFVLKEGWGKLLYDVCVVNKMACFVQHYDISDNDKVSGASLYSDIFIIDNKWYNDNNVRLAVAEVKLGEIFPDNKAGGILLGLHRGGDSELYLFDTGTIALGKALESGSAPILNNDFFMELHNEWFFHLEHSGLLYTQFNHPAMRNLETRKMYEGKFLDFIVNKLDKAVLGSLLVDNCFIDRKDVLLKCKLEDLIRRMKIQ